VSRARTFIALALILVASNVATTVVAIRASNRSAVASQHATELARETAALTATVQLQRVNATFAQCTQQNAHKTKAVARLRQLVAVAEGRATPGARARAIASEAPTILLIDALQPHRDCPAVVYSTTGVRVTKDGEIVPPSKASRTTP
jgi:hypothetical protein